MANNAALAGHVVLEDRVYIGGLSGIHQFVRIGEGAFIGALSMVTKDVIPFGLSIGNRNYLQGLNLIGLRRQKYDNQKINIRMKKLIVEYIKYLRTKISLSIGL